MIIRFFGFLVILIVALVLLVVYASQNNQPVTVSLFENHWRGVAGWVPAAISAGAVAVLFLLYLLIAGLGSRIERASLRRRLAQLEGRINERETENQQLRDRTAAAETANTEAAARPVSPPERPAGG